MGRLVMKESSAKSEGPSGSGQHDRFPDIGLFIATITYLGYFVLISVGHLRDFFGSFTGLSRYNGLAKRKKGYGILVRFVSDVMCLLRGGD